jgi:hypothetical protein
LQTLTDISEVLTASNIRAMIALMMEPVNISETSVNFRKATRHNTPEDSHFHTHPRENLFPFDPL